MSPIRPSLDSAHAAAPYAGPILTGACTAALPAKHASLTRSSRRSSQTRLIHPQHQAMTTSSILGRIYQTVRGSFVITPWLLQLAVADLILSALLPLSIFFPNLIYHSSSRVAQSVWRAVQLIFTRYNGAKITISGDDLPQGESAIVVCNHVSWTDFYLIQELAIRSRMLGYCRWFAKQQLKWVPFLGWGLWALGMPLISRNWLQDQRELRRVFGGVVERQWPMCMSGAPSSLSFVAWLSADDN